MRNILLVGLLLLGLVGCATTDEVGQAERQQQDTAQLTIIQNQPAPDLGGYSFERQIVIETYLARNRTIATYTYLLTLEGRIIEICASIGYPIPYATQITNPEKLSRYYETGGYIEGVVSNAEPNGLYTPADAAATLVQCVNPDGSVSPTMFEPTVFALPYRIASDIQLQRLDNTQSFSVDINK